jgi:hypothetical protein
VRPANLAELDIFSPDTYAARGYPHEAWARPDRDGLEGECDFVERVAFRHRLARLAQAELAGRLGRLRSSQVGGIKRLPIRYRLHPAA